MQLPYSEELNIEYLGQLFRNTTECYKFFWFKAIVKKVKSEKVPSQVVFPVELIDRESTK